MASSVTDICNRALDAIGVDPIGALTDRSKAARLCGDLFAEMRDSLLRDHPWNFAIRRAMLAASATTPAFDWAYAYPLPSDCLRVIRTNNPDPLVRWDVEAGQVLTNIGSPLGIVYVARVTDTTHWDAGFVLAMQARLAAELCMPLTQNVGNAQGLAKLAEQRLAEARSQNATEKRPERLYADDLIVARL
jgi:hypothetical protein